MILLEEYGTEEYGTEKGINASKPKEIVNLPPAIYPEIRNLQKQINKNGTQEPNQLNETRHQRQSSSNNVNTTNQQRETGKREPVSQKQVSESGETDPLTTQ
ncbi:Hypothetical_protein [Hexamita inflata]|uniref:Hypothetical_protein n=1 Tax=Hexamita inflata TaxID=28002 RepID=A0AA86NRX9_9EUKA|nr:Hypothetical protein HINF_LOCUS11396 [Hexamita inflata]